MSDKVSKDREIFNITSGDLVSKILHRQCWKNDNRTSCNFSIPLSTLSFYKIPLPLVLLSIEFKKKEKKKNPYTSISSLKVTLSLSLSLSRCPVEGIIETTKKKKKKKVKSLEQEEKARGKMEENWGKIGLIPKFPKMELGTVFNEL